MRFLSPPTLPDSMLMDVDAMVDAPFLLFRKLLIGKHLKPPGKNSLQTFLATFLLRDIN